MIRNRKITSAKSIAFGLRIASDAMLDLRRLLHV
jgi:hypothetical protein